MSGLEINRFLQFQRLIFFYLESFTVSKIFIFFGVGSEGAAVWHGFCCTYANVNDNLNDCRDIGYDDENKTKFILYCLN